jgi:hypothetical protein
MDKEINAGKSSGSNRNVAPTVSASSLAGLPGVRARLGMDGKMAQAGREHVCAQSRQNAARDRAGADGQVRQRRQPGEESGQFVQRVARRRP